jgi:hypothetical protein
MADPYYPSNADRVSGGRLQLTGVLQAVKLPDLSIPDGFALVIKSHPTNPIGSFILVASSKTDATNQDTSWPLIPGESIAYKIKNASSIYVAATVAPAYVSWTVEQRSS